MIILLLHFVCIEVVTMLPTRVFSLMSGDARLSLFGGVTNDVQC